MSVAAVWQKTQRLRHTIRGYVAAELTRNPLLHYAIAAALLLVLLAAWQWIDDARSSASEIIAAARQELSELQRMATQSEWPARRDTVKRLQAQFEARLWPVESDGLALANFQELIVRLAQANGLAKIEVRTEMVPNGSNPLKLRQMSASVSGTFDAAQLQQLLASVAREERLIVVERLKISTAPAARFDMLLIAFLRHGQTPPAKAIEARRS